MNYDPVYLGSLGSLGGMEGLRRVMHERMRQNVNLEHIKDFLEG